MHDGAVVGDQAMPTAADASDRQALTVLFNTLVSGQTAPPTRIK